MPQTPYNAVLGMTPVHISNAGTHVVMAEGGLLASVIINGGTAGATIEMFDNNVTQTGTAVIGEITLAGTVFPMQPVNYNATVNNGVVVVATGTFDATILVR